MAQGISADRVVSQGIITPGNLASFVDGMTVQDAAIAAALQMRRKATRFTPAQIQALDNTAATALEIVPAPDSDKLIIPQWIYFNLQFATTPYATGTGTVTARWMKPDGNLNAIAPAINSVATATDIKNTASVLNSAGPTNQHTTANVASLLGNSLVLTLGNSTKFTAGDSPILIVVLYRIYPGIA